MFDQIPNWVSINSVSACIRLKFPCFNLLSRSETGTQTTPLSTNRRNKRKRTELDENENAQDDRHTLEPSLITGHRTVIQLVYVYFTLIYCTKHIMQ